MALANSSTSGPLPCTTRSDYLSALPRWRRWLATLNWRPVVDFELREIAFEQRRIEHEQRMKELENEDRRLAGLESRLAALLRNPGSCSQAPPSTDSN